MKERYRGAVLITVGLLALVGCAERPAGSRADSAEDPAVRFGACADPSGDWAPADGYVASVERWLEVVADPGPVDGTGNLEVPMEVRALDGSGDPTGPVLKESVYIHASMVPGVSWALSGGGRAYLGLATTGFEREVVLFALVVAPDGGPFFAGECGYDKLTAPLRARLGDRFDAVLDGIVGTTDREEILGVLEAPPSPSATPPVILNPEDADPALLRSLTPITVALDVPLEWRGPFTICTRIEEGWNDCLDLGGSRREVESLGAYLGESRVLQVWLLDRDADLTRPIQLLGAVDASVVAAEILEAGAAIRVGVSGALSPTDRPPVREPRVRILDAESFEVLRSDPERSVAVLGIDITDGPQPSPGRTP